MTTINWQEMMANSQKIGEPVPEGDYPAVAEEASYGSSKGNEPQWRVTWKLVGGPHNNRRVLDQFTLSQKPDEKGAQTRGFFFRDMKSLGLDDAFFATMPDENFIAQRLTGLQAMLSLTVNDRGYNNVQRYALIAGAAQAQPAQQAQPAPGGFQPQAQPMPQQGFQQPMQQGFQPAAAAPQPQPMQQPQYQQPMQPQQAPGFAQPQPQPMQAPQQGGFQQPQQFEQAPQPAQQQMPMQQAPQGFQQPQMGVQGPMPPQQVQLGPDGQPLQQPTQVDPNGFTPQPQAPF